MVEESSLVAEAVAAAAPAEASGDDDNGETTATTELATAVAAAAAEVIMEQQQQQEQQQIAEVPPPPPPLPVGWHLKESRSNPGYYYYFHQDTGVCTWQSPIVEEVDTTTTAATATSAAGSTDPVEKSMSDQASVVSGGMSSEGGGSANDDDDDYGDDDAAAAGEFVTGGKKRNAEQEGQMADASYSQLPTSNKRIKGASKQLPSKVRILHILKKHAGSRRPSSWRQSTITITLEEAREQLQELLEVLKEEGDEGLRATFEELARTESDCSSAKRGGDLGFFGPKKMQPAFEAASFALELGELSDLVETSSGLHILLRIG